MLGREKSTSMGGIVKKCGLEKLDMIPPLSSVLREKRR
jgi:hypothetical protein